MDRAGGEDLGPEISFCLTLASLDWEVRLSNLSEISFCFPGIDGNSGILHSFPKAFGLCAFSS